MTIQVSDSGAGMDEKQIKRLLEEEEQPDRRGLGIGFSYVNRLLRRYFAGQAHLHIESGRGLGTVISIVIPTRSKEDFYDAQSYGGG